MPSTALDYAGQDQLFRNARSQNKWKTDPLPNGILEQVYDLMKGAETRTKCAAARFTFIVSDAAKERLRPTLAPQNVDKCLTAPAAVLKPT